MDTKLVLGAVIFVVAGLGITGHGAYTWTVAAAGHDTAATVTRCTSHSTSSHTKTSKRGGSVTTCYGTWRTGDGRTHQGEITGTSRDDLNHQVTVAVVNDTTAQHESTRDSAYAILGGVGSAALGGFFLFKEFRPGQRRRH